jgi:hypothetical protein
VTTLHVYTADHQPATRYRVDLGGLESVRRKKKRYLRISQPPRSTVLTSCCRKFRAAANCTVQVFYDDVRYWCRHGVGCRVPSRRRRVTRRVLLREFASGKSVRSLARTYGQPRVEIERRLRG